jgi:class 3 adenylate cyclase/predicted ATPase
MIICCQMKRQTNLAGHPSQSRRSSVSRTGCRTMDIGSWLLSLGLEQYEALFRENDIDAEVLGDLTDADLEKLGVTLGHRKRLLKAIGELASADKIAPPTSLAPSTTAERRPITVMFCDLVGSTSLAAKLDAEDWRTLVNTYLDEASAAVTGLGGHVLKRLGDGLMALFGYPHAQENDAERAVRAALAIQRALVEINARNASRGTQELQARIGLDSGQVVVDSAGEVFGDAPNIAARVQGAADPGSILITATVQRQTAGLFVSEDRGQHELKGMSAPMTLYRIVRASGGGRRGGARALTSFVGREEDIGTLLRRWDRVRAGDGQFVLIVGEPGLGKSRLIEEFHTRLGETPHTWTECSSSQLLQNTPLHPLAEWGRLRFGEDLPAEQRLADLENTLRLVGLDVGEYAPLIAPLVDIPLPKERAAEFAPEELRRRQLAAVTAWFLAGARTQPVVLAFEDLHWADPTSLDLIQALAERGAQAPLLVVATTRPEFRAPWGMRSHHAVVALAPLDRTEVRRMVGDIAAQHALPQEVVERVSERTGGVPLFVEEVTRLLVERGDTGSQGVPPTLQQSLAARLDRLGEAREVAQIGAVLGRDFAYALLRDVAGLDESALQPALERLTKVDLLFVEGAPPQANYRFKHALIQDAAYDSLLKNRRQALHRRAAELLRDNPDRAIAEPEVIAHHFAEGGLDDLAIEWWGKAGDQALRRSAFQEAIAHLGKAIEMADKGAVGSAAMTTVAEQSRRLKLQTNYAQAVLWSKGFAADETRAAFERTRDLATRAAELPAEGFPALFGQFLWSLLHGDIHSARQIADRFLQEAEEQGRLSEAGVGHRIVGLTSMFSGDLVEARSHLEAAIRTYDRERDSEVKEKFALDTGVAARVYLALASWLAGDLRRATQLIEEAMGLGGDLGHLPDVIHALWYKVYIQCLRNDPESVAVDAENLLRTSQQHGVELFVMLADVALDWARGRLGDARSGANGLRRSLAEYTSKGNRLFVPPVLALLAELESAAGDVERAQSAIDEGLTMAQEGGQHYADSFLHRIHGDLLLKLNPNDPEPAAAAYKTAVEVSEHQGMRTYRLLASLSLAKLHLSTARPAEAHAVLAPALEGFSPTPEMPEITEAQALLVALLQSDEVKAEAARRQRLTHLQVAYGNALIAARGYGAPETTEAFARARESAAGDKDAPGRLSADYGLWVGSFTRGDLPSMRAHSADFLDDVAARPDSPEAGVAHRVAGATCWFAGEYREARDHLERALAMFQPSRDDDMAFRFGQDPGVSAMAYLALVLWPSGKIERAVSFISRMLARIASLAHSNTVAFGHMFASQFALMLGGPMTGNANFLELARIARAHDLAQFRAFGMFFDGWARVESDLLDGLDGMRSGVDSLRAQNILIFDGLVKIALARTEAETGDTGRVVAILDEALATADRLGHRTFEAELHRTRGQLLLNRDPANPAPAEDAFLTAIAVAKQQGTRSFELRAAQKLAKLYQSTTRLVEAHAILAPALEGFSPTEEMPEIAEARALLAAIETGTHVRHE